MIVLISLCIVLSYLVGACPNGVLVARANGVDIRAVGSGNIGATNVFRSVGKGAGLAVFLLDALKGFVPAFVLPRVVESLFPGVLPEPPTPGLWFGIAAIVGHSWPVYLGFKGGKGVATSAGVLIGIAPVAAGFGLLAWLALVLTTRYVSVGSMGAAVAVAVTGWATRGSTGTSLPLTLTGLACLVVWRHRSNLQRLASGTENRFTFRRKAASADRAATEDEGSDPRMEGKQG